MRFFYCCFFYILQNCNYFHYTFDDFRYLFGVLHGLLVTVLTATCGIVVAHFIIKVQYLHERERRKRFFNFNFFLIILPQLDMIYCFIMQNPVFFIKTTFCEKFPFLSTKQNIQLR
jgi:hypothetical protein